jgi:hypothetical protein
LSVSLMTTLPTAPVPVPGPDDPQAVNSGAASGKVRRTATRWENVLDFIRPIKTQSGSRVDTIDTSGA